MFARIGLGAFLSAADYIEAVRQRRELCVETAQALAGVDIIVSAMRPGRRRGSTRSDLTPPSTVLLLYRADNVTGLPALSVPIGFESDLPLAFQIAGKPFDEAAVLRTGFAFEQASEFDDSGNRHAWSPPGAVTGSRRALVAALAAWALAGAGMCRDRRRCTVRCPGIAELKLGPSELHLVLSGGRSPRR